MEITTNVYLFHALTWAAAEISLKEKPPAAAVLNWLLLLWHEFGTCSAISGNFGELTFLSYLLLSTENVFGIF